MSTTPKPFLKAVGDRDLTIGGPTIAARAFEAGLVDEVHLFVSPVIIGAGLRGAVTDPARRRTR